MDCGGCEQRISATASISFASRHLRKVSMIDLVEQTSSVHYQFTAKHSSDESKSYLGRREMDQ